MNIYRFRDKVVYRLFLTVTLLALVLGSQAVTTTVVRADTNTLTLSVVSANDSATYGITKGDPITEFKYMINIDNTGTTVQRNPAPGSGCSPADADYPDTSDRIQWWNCRTADMKLS